MVKIISCECNSKTGVLHLLQGKENEDAVTARCNGTLGVIAVCDGAGAMKAGGEAAKIVSEVIADTLFADFSDLYVCSVERIKSRVIDSVEQCLNKLAKEKDIPASECACTIMAAAVDNEGRCLSLHLGDGIIVGKRNSKWYDVSLPLNGLLKSTTYLTMNCDMWERLHVCRWKDLNLESIALTTDGVTEMSLSSSWQTMFDLEDIKKKNYGTGIPGRCKYRVYNQSDNLMVV